MVLDKNIDYKYKQLDNGLKIAYREVGTGKTLFCIPPWGCSTAAYVPLMNGLAENFHIIALDLPGWGGESDRWKKEVSFNEYRDIVAEIINSFGVKDYDILGYSMGGTLTMHAMAKKLIEPERVFLLSTIVSSKDLEKLPRYNKAKNLYAKVRNWRLAISLIKMFMKINYRSTTYFNSFYKRPENAKKMLSLLHDNETADIRCVIDSILDIEEVDFKALASSKSKFHIIYSTNDDMYIKGGSKRLSKNIGIKPVVIDTYDHRHIFFETEKALGVIFSILKG